MLERIVSIPWVSCMHHFAVSHILQQAIDFWLTAPMVSIIYSIINYLSFIKLFISFYSFFISSFWFAKSSTRKIYYLSCITTASFDEGPGFISKCLRIISCDDIWQRINPHFHEKWHKKGNYQIIFISPEALFVSTEWRNVLSSDVFRNNLVGFVIDEAHCVKKWLVIIIINNYCICII